MTKVFGDDGGETFLECGERQIELRWRQDVDEELYGDRHKEDLGRYNERFNLKLKSLYLLVREMVVNKVSS